MQSPTDQYLTQRRASGWEPSSRFDTAPTFRIKPGFPFEMNGRLSGVVVGNADSTMLILTLSDNSTVRLEISIQPSWLRPGSFVRVLAIVTEEGAAGVMMGIPPMTVIAVASASEVAMREAAWLQERMRSEERWRLADSGPTAPSVTKSVIPKQMPKAVLAKPTSVGLVARIRASLSQQSQSVFGSYKGYIKRHNKRLTDTQADQITYGILRFSEEYDLDPRLAVATVVAESDFRVMETSHKGAMGLIQLMPDEVKRLRLSNPYDPVQNLAGGIYLIKERLNKYSKSTDFSQANFDHLALALASYNAGMGAVKRWHGIPPYRETQGYDRRIIKLYRELCSSDPRP